MHILDWQPLSLAVARAFGAAGSRFATVSAELTEATVDCLAECHELTVPTRHGDVRCLVYRAPDETTARPLYVNMHGGGFVVRFPEMDEPMCHYLSIHRENSGRLDSPALAGSRRFDDWAVHELVRGVRRRLDGRDAGAPTAAGPERAATCMGAVEWALQY
jgi:hypothetical protein